MSIEDVITYFIFISNNKSYSSCYNCNGKSCRSSIINSIKLYRMIYLAELTYYAVFGKSMLSEKISCNKYGSIYYNIGLNSHREKIQYPTGKQIEQACARLSDKVKELIRTTYGLFGNESCESLIDLCCNTTPYIESIARNYKYIDKRLFKFDKDLHDKCINMEGND